MWNGVSPKSSFCISACDRVSGRSAPLGALSLLLDRLRPGSRPLSCSFLCVGIGPLPGSVDSVRNSIPGCLPSGPVLDVPADVVGFDVVEVFDGGSVRAPWLGSVPPSAVRDTGGFPPRTPKDPPEGRVPEASVLAEVSIPRILVVVDFGLAPGIGTVEVVEVPPVANSGPKRLVWLGLLGVPGFVPLLRSSRSRFESPVWVAPVVSVRLPTPLLVFCLVTLVSGLMSWRSLERLRS